MMRRKRIAVLMAGVDREYQLALTRGMTRAARSAGADLCIFNCQGQPDGFVRNDRGERAIFDLPDFGEFDGVVLLLATVPTKICRDQIRERLSHYPELPLVTIDVRYGQSVQVGFDDAVSVKELVQHLLDAHGVKRFAVVTGPQETRVAMGRYEACRTVLAQRGIELPQDAVYDGRWGREGGRAAVEHFLEKLPERPEVIVCGNDDMAFGVIEGLRAVGLQVPQDVLVTGFDARQEAVGRGLTTIRRPVRKAGELAVETLLDWMEHGRPDVDEITLPTQLVYGESCGCDLEPARSAACVQMLSDERRLMEKCLRQTTEFTTSLAEVSTLREVGDQLTAFARGWHAREMHVCVTPNYMDGDSQDFPKKYPEEMLLLSGWSESGEESPQKRFPTSQLLPRLAEEHDRPMAVVFSPLYYMEKNLGYLVFDVEHVVSAVLPSLLLLMSSSLMSLCLRVAVQAQVADLESISTHDVLTGLLNRRGLRQMMPQAFGEARAEHRPFAVVCCDMDNLKGVNDSFGHQAGDQAICRLGRAFRALEGAGLTCVHVSGDEFIAFGIPREGLDDQALLQHLKDSLHQVNQEPDWPTTISASMGAYLEVPAANARVEEFLRNADNSLYAEKHRRHRRIGLNSGDRGGLL